MLTCLGGWLVVLVMSGLPGPLIQTGNKPAITTMDRMEPAASHHQPYLRTVRVTVGGEARVLSAPQFSRCLNQYGAHLPSPVSLSQQGGQVPSLLPLLYKPGQG